ncbi:MAG: winged helix-turn-helix domain-containing protein [Proteobacteria bacterium]|nr:winged helix-turn-helix domain-containing protein [Pseudomonadota bacterium]
MSLNELFTSKIRIIEALRRAEKPLIAQHIAKRSHLYPQLVRYHLGQMVEWGMVTTSTVEDKTFYQLQQPYCDEQLMEVLSELLIPYMQHMSEGMDFSQAKVSVGEAVIRNLFMLLRMFETEIDESFSKE